MLGLESKALAPFKTLQGQIDQEDMTSFRVLRNLITCDWNLMLSSGFPMTTEPENAAGFGELITSQSTAQVPGDMRISALMELVVLVRRATRSAATSSGRHFSLKQMQKLNLEMDEWEERWAARLCGTPHQHNSLPFTSLRWCRLALNSAQLQALLSPEREHQGQQLRASLPLLQSLTVALNAALDTWLALTRTGSRTMWPDNQLDAKQRFDQEVWPDEAAVDRLKYSVDSTWISLTFAFAFLVLCYVRGVVDCRIVWFA